MHTLKDGDYLNVYRVEKEGGYENTRFKIGGFRYGKPRQQGADVLSENNGCRYMLMSIFKEVTLVGRMKITKLR